ncbi:hypothetical protein FRB96_008573, partial [Tulasnella sp. 330]
MFLGMLHTLVAQVARVFAGHWTPRQTINSPSVGSNDEPSSLPHHVNEPTTSPIAQLILQSCGIQRFEHSKQQASTANLDASLRYFQMAMNLSAPGHPLQPVGLYKCSVALLARFALRGDVADLGNAVRRLGDLLDAEPSVPPLRPLTLKTLADAHHIQSKNSEDMSDVQPANDQQVVALCAPDDPGQGVGCFCLAVALVRRFQATNLVPDLDDAITLYGKVLEGHRSGRMRQSTTLTNLAMALRFRYALTKDPVDYSRALACEEEARNLCSVDGGDHPSSQIPVTNSRIALWITSMNHDSVLIEAGLTSTIAQIKDMVRDKTGASKGIHALFCDGRLLSDEWTIGQCIGSLGSMIYVVDSVGATATKANMMPVTHAAGSLLSPVEVAPTTNPTSEEQKDQIPNPLSIAPEHEVVHLVTPGATSVFSDASGPMGAMTERFVEMGFSHEDVMLAIVAAEFQGGLAMEYLLNGIPEDIKADTVAAIEAVENGRYSNTELWKPELET